MAIWIKLEDFRKEIVVRYESIISFHIWKILVEIYFFFNVLWR